MISLHALINRYGFEDQNIFENSPNNMGVIQNS